MSHEHRPIIVVRRQALFDVAVNGKQLAEAVGLPPISDEVAEMERQDSAKRLNRVGRLAGAVEDHTLFLTNVFTAVKRYAAEAHGVNTSDEAWEVVSAEMHTLLNVTSMSMLSLFVDLGILNLPPEWEQPSEDRL